MFILILHTIYRLSRYFCIPDEGVGSGSFGGAEVLRLFLYRVFLYLGEFSVVGGLGCGYYFCLIGI
jgi:hypothetical protein